MAGSRVVGRSAPLTVAARGDAPAPCPCAGVSPCGAGPAWASVLGGRALQHTQTDVGCPPGPRLRLAGALLPWPPSACEGPRTGSHQLTAGPLPEAVWPLLLPLVEPASGASAPGPPTPLMASSRRAMRHLSGLASGALAHTPPLTRTPHPRHTHTPYTLHTHAWTHTPSPHAHAFARWRVLSSAFRGSLCPHTSCLLLCAAGYPAWGAALGTGTRRGLWGAGPASPVCPRVAGLVSAACRRELVAPGSGPRSLGSGPGAGPRTCLGCSQQRLRPSASRSREMGLGLRGAGPRRSPFLCPHRLGCRSGVGTDRLGLRAPRASRGPGPLAVNDATRLSALGAFRIWEWRSEGRSELPGRGGRAGARAVTLQPWTLEEWDTSVPR